MYDLFICKGNDGGTCKVLWKPCPGYDVCTSGTCNHCLHKPEKPGDEAVCEHCLRK